MDLSIVKAVPQYAVKALGVTLMHSLWQGLLLAVVAGIIMVCTRKKSAARRYNLLIAALALFSFTITYTFFAQLQIERINAAVMFSDHPNVAGIYTPTLPFIIGSTTDLGILDLIGEYAHAIVLIWLLIVLARVFQLFTGLQGLYHLRKNAAYNISTDWQDRVEELSTKLGINKFVSIAESGIARVPMVIGHLKPLILIPIGLMTALPPQEIEAILVHELAHIKRSDHLMNMLVSLLEIMFFFNPAVLWIASLIRTERENCCDDIAVAQTSSKVNYIRALVSCQEYQLSAHAYAMALNGYKKPLMGRVNRLLSNKNSSLNVTERSVLAVCLLTAMLFTAAFSGAYEIHTLVTKTPTKVLKTNGSVAIPQEKVKQEVAIRPAISTEKKGKRPAVKNSGGWASIDAPKYRIYWPEEVGDHTSVKIKNGTVQTRLVKQDGTLYQLNSNGKKVISLQINGHNVKPGDHNVPLEQLMPLDIIKPGRSDTGMLSDKLHVLNTQRANTDQKPNYIADTAKPYKPYQNEYRTHNSTYPAPVSPVVAIDGRVPVSMKLNSNVAVNADVVQQIANAIITDGLVSNIASFKMTESELILNGLKLPEESFKQFKNKNINSFKEGTTLYYNYNTNTTVTIN